MCQSVCLYRKTADWIVDYVFAYFLADRKIIFSYNFVSPLTLFKNKSLCGARKMNISTEVTSTYLKTCHI